MQETCYFCGQPATSGEHAPPRCIFPAQKDTNGKDYRKNLIKVPSCDLHNSQKSNDDEYLMLVLASCLDGNQIAKNQVKYKIIRTIRNSPIKAKLLKNPELIHVGGEQILKIELDLGRFATALELIAHALHYHYFKSRALRNYEFLSAPVFEFDDENSNIVNQSRMKILDLAQNALCDFPRLGNNQEIFWYQITPETEGKHVIRLCFYEAFPVLLMTA